MHEKNNYKYYGECPYEGWQYVCCCVCIDTFVVDSGIISIQSIIDGVTYPDIDDTHTCA